MRQIWAFGPPHVQSTGSWVATAFWERRPPWIFTLCRAVRFLTPGHPPSFTSLAWLRKCSPGPSQPRGTGHWMDSFSSLRAGSEVEPRWVVGGRAKPGIWNQMCRTVDSGFLDRWGYNIFSASFYLLFWCFPNILQQTCISFVIKKIKIFKKLKRIWNRIFFFWDSATMKISGVL